MAGVAPGHDGGGEGLPRSGGPCPEGCGLLTHMHEPGPPGPSPLVGCKEPPWNLEAGAAPLGPRRCPPVPPAPTRWPTPPSQHPACLLCTKGLRGSQGPGERLPRRPPAQSGAFQEEPGKGAFAWPETDTSRTSYSLHPRPRTRRQQPRKERPRRRALTCLSQAYTHPSGPAQPPVPAPRELTAGGQERASGLRWGPGARKGDGALEDPLLQTPLVGS